MILNDLTHAVEVKWNNRQFWELMAAFNCEQAAKDYADECRRHGKPMVFRVRSTTEKSES